MFLSLEAALQAFRPPWTLPKWDYKVHLVERLPSIGGKMSQLDKTFPTNDCAL